MMSTTTIGLTAGSRLLGSSDFYSNTTEKLSCSSDLTYTFILTKNAITAKKSSNRDSNGRRVLKEHASIGANPLSSTEQWVQSFDRLEDEGTKHELSVEALLLLQKSLLEKQWEISTGVNTAIATPTEKSSKKVHVTGSQISARKRRLDAQKKTLYNCSDMQLTIGPELFRNQFKGRVKDESTEVLLTHSEVIVLSKKIKTGLNLEEQKLSNVRLVMSVVQRYDNMGAQMADLIQGGLIGLLRGIERYDSSRGYKMSTNLQDPHESKEMRALEDHALSEDKLLKE
ncbi:RNA polymerase sigma factor sigA-like protein [Tanacetum coccineum]